MLMWLINIVQQQRRLYQGVRVTHLSEKTSTSRILRGLVGDRVSLLLQRQI
jgi:hypothetical protein